MALKRYSAKWTIIWITVVTKKSTTNKHRNDHEYYSVL